MGLIYKGLKPETAFNEYGTWKVSIGVLNERMFLLLFNVERDNLTTRRNHLISDSEFDIVLHWIELCCIVLYYIVLYCTVLHTVLNENWGTESYTYGYAYIRYRNLLH